MDATTFGIMVALSSIIPALLAYRLQESAMKLPIIYPSDAIEEKTILQARSRMVATLTSRWKLAIILNVLLVVAGALISGGLVIGVTSIMVYGIPLLVGARDPFHGSCSDPLERIGRHLDRILEKNKENPERIEIAIQRLRDNYGMSTSEHERLLLHLSGRRDPIGRLAEGLLSDSHHE